MSIFSKIKNAIFGHPAAAAEQASTSPSPSAGLQVEPSATTAAPIGGTAPVTPATSGAAPAASANTRTASQPVDIAPILDSAVKQSGQKLDWKHSIVDLMKALGMDASLAERKELADELGYPGEKDGSAAMNTWLHKALLKKLSENGGKVPAELLD
ncbi:DUF3597 family protein [Rhizobiales bacterium RZME27]|uniref:DUF3597 family protein n=1 Tax=Endobacterium cereale TaxID=2663029 RepID=A0A6A8A9G0_9HYPH|nr:DUF3597 domain-containing protein [Endobacterium cereale]MEB2846774.1 DUF3597 domain-containing protein [Endobacterium cereale]MQY46507.1 DUF3597 family protein [Endobacterium cereale]